MTPRVLQFMVLVAICCVAISASTLGVRWLDQHRRINVEVIEVTECPV